MYNEQKTIIQSDIVASERCHDMTCVIVNSDDKDTEFRNSETP